MPLPTDMKTCMHKTKEEFPHGRSDKKKGKKAAHKQRVAMCLSASGQSKNESKYLTFKEFLTETQ